MNPLPGILGPNGQPVSAERVKLEKMARFNPLRNWSPEILVTQLEAYSRGEIFRLAWVMDWLEKHDDVISTVAPKAKAAVSHWGYDILPKDEITPKQKQQAMDQQGVLQAFYQDLKTSDAIELEESGGMRLLVQQIMDAYGKGYAAHHIIWNPSTSGLKAELIKVPTWMFECVTGKLRFLLSFGAQRGVELETLGGRGAWMVSKGRGVMLAGCIASIFKQLPLQDWLTYCDRHGMPAFLGKTGAAQGSKEWSAMVSAVSSIGSEFGAVVNTADMIEVLQLATQGQLPYVALVERMDRAQVMLWRGGDLSTMSRINAVGSNPQQEDSDELDADNAAWVSETINSNLTNKVVAWNFGPGAPVLCELKIRTKTRVDTQQDLAIVNAAVGFGLPVDRAWFCGKFGIVLADPGASALSVPATPQPNPATEMAGATAINTAPGGDLSENILHTLRGTLAQDMRPLGDALWAAYQSGDLPAMQAALKKISAGLPHQVGNAQASTDALATALAAAYVGKKH